LRFKVLGHFGWSLLLVCLKFPRWSGQPDTGTDGSRGKQSKLSGKSNMSKRYTPEFKRDAVDLVRSSGRNVTEVARELGVSAEGLRGWVKQAKIDRGEGAPGALTTAEKEELQRLRRENREQQQTIEILKKGLAFFAKETMK
jgi:transposase